jgi:hypothetical protein
LADRLAAYEIVTRLRLMPRLATFADSCRAITSSLEGDR